MGGRHPVSGRHRRALLARGALVRTGAAGAVLGVLVACAPSVPVDQTTSVDVARYHVLASDPWLAATSLTVGRHAPGTNREFAAGAGSSTRTATGTAAQVLTSETDAAGRLGWVVAAARCGDDADAGSVTVQFVRTLSDRSVAVAQVRLEQDQTARTGDGSGTGDEGAAADQGVDDEGGGDAAALRTVPRRVLLSAYVPHHTNEARIDVPSDPLAYDALSCLGGDGGTSLGPQDLLAVVQGGEGAVR